MLLISNIFLYTARTMLGGIPCNHRSQLATTTTTTLAWQLTEMILFQNSTQYTSCLFPFVGPTRSSPLQRKKRLCLLINSLRFILYLKLSRSFRHAVFPTLAPCSLSLNSNLFASHSLFVIAIILHRLYRLHTPTAATRQEFIFCTSSFRDTPLFRFSFC